MHHVLVEEWIMKSTESDIIEIVEDLVGRTSDTRYDLLFTTTKLVAAIILHPSDLADVYTKRTPLEEMIVGGGMRRKEAQVLSRKIQNDRRAGLRNRTASEILSAHRANFEILYKDVLSAKIRKGLFGVSLEFNVNSLNGVRGKCKFQLHEEQVENVQRLLSLTLPGKAV
jgi:hypothetical protein